MPYLLHPATETPNPDAHRAFTNRADAHAAKTSGEAVTYHETTTDRLCWQEREEQRFYTSYNGTQYRPVPWCGYNSADNTSRWACWNCRTPEIQAHYAHMSTKTPGLIAYTPTAEHGYQDRQVCIKPGKYLEAYFADVPRSQRQAWIAACVPPELQAVQFARTPDECERVYRGRDYPEGHPPFVSCMGPDGHSKGFTPGAFPWAYYPTRVYGDSDLAVAYLGSIDACTARTVVWPDKRRYGRCYGLCDHLVLALRAAGYTESSDFEGACICKIQRPGFGYVVPYMDAVSAAEDIGDGYLQLGSGTISLREIDGYAGNGDNDNEDEDSAPDTLTCEHCGDEFDDDGDGSSYCPSCEDARQYCDGCNTDRWDDNPSVRAVSEDTFWPVDTRAHRSYEWRCEACCENHKTECANEDCADTWCEWQLTEAQQLARIAAGLTDYCADCAEGRLACHACRVPYVAAEHAHCPQATCGVVARCSETLTLPLEAPEPVPLVMDLPMPAIATYYAATHVTTLEGTV